MKLSVQGQEKGSIKDEHLSIRRGYRGYIPESGTYKFEHTGANTDRTGNVQHGVITNSRSISKGIPNDTIHGSGGLQSSGPDSFQERE